MRRPHTLRPERSGRARGLPALALALLLALGACSTGSDFPDPSSPVSKITWPDYELLRYDIVDQTDEFLGQLELEVERQDDEFQLRLLFTLDDSGVRDEAFLRVDAETLRPLRYQRTAAGPDETIEIVGDYSVDAEGRTVVDSTVIENGEPRQELIEAGEFAFDNDTAAWLWRSIEFRQDFEVTYRSVNVFFQRAQLVRLSVEGQDQLRTPQGDFVAWRVAATPGVEVNTVWYQVDPPHVLVRWDQQPRRFLLREIVTQKPGG